MTSINKRVPLNGMISEATRAELEYLAQRQDTSLIDAVRDAVHQWASLLRRVDEGATLLLKEGDTMIQIAGGRGILRTSKPITDTIAIPSNSSRPPADQHAVRRAPLPGRPTPGDPNAKKES